jgi:hypothetical protein
MVSKMGSGTLKGYSPLKAGYKETWQTEAEI